MKSSFRSGEEERSGSPKVTVKQIVAIQMVVIVYTISSVFAKLASEHEFLSLGFFLLYGAEICGLGIYALLWQQIIKRVDLSIAYANRSVALIWSMAWSVLFFHEGITWNNVIGVLIVLAGTILVNTDHD